MPKLISRKAPEPKPNFTSDIPTSPRVAGPITGSVPDKDFPRLNEKQLAERWGVSVRTLQAARINGSGVPFVRIGRSVRYRLEDVLAYEQGRLRTSTSENP